MNKKQWTTEENQYIIENFGKWTFSDMSKKLGCAITTVEKRAIYLGLNFEKKTAKRWTEEEIKTAETLFESGNTYQEISDVIERSEWAVANLLRNLGYSYRLPQYWKGKELKYLRENYQKMTYEEIAHELGRTTKSVGAKAKEMGFQKRLIRKNQKGSGQNG